MNQDRRWRGFGHQPENPIQTYPATLGVALTEVALKINLAAVGQR